MKCKLNCGDNLWEPNEASKLRTVGSNNSTSDIGQKELKNQKTISNTMKDTSDSKLDDEFAERHESHTVDTDIRGNLRIVSHTRSINNTRSFKRQVGHILDACQCDF